MIHISTKSSVVTLINVVTVDPTNQHRLVELLTRATEVSVRQAAGFVSASLHRSRDGTKVTMYAQWRSVEDYQAMRQDGAPLPFLQEALALATFEPGMYEVVQTFAPLGEDAYHPSRHTGKHEASSQLASSLGKAQNSNRCCVRLPKGILITESREPPRLWGVSPGAARPRPLHRSPQSGNAWICARHIRSK